MNHFLSGFAHELVKLSGSKDELDRIYRDVKRQSQKGVIDDSLKALRGQGQRVSRDYLASTLVGAVGAPAAKLLGAKLTKSTHNKSILRAMMSTPNQKRRRMLAQNLETRSLVAKGSGIGLPHKKDPIISHADLVGTAARGGVAGSVFQMLKDRFSGAARYQNQ